MLIVQEDHHRIVQRLELLSPSVGAPLELAAVVEPLLQHFLVVCVPAFVASAW
jgi:hypothetical protein